MNNQIKKSLKYIEENFHNDFTVDDLAKVAGYSKYHFSRLFKETTGESVLEYINRLKLEKASIKLMNRKPIIKVALDTGYHSSSSFNKAFKQKYGLSPTQSKKIKTNQVENYSNTLSKLPEVIEVNEKYIVFIREVGEYYESGKKAWETLFNLISNYEAKYTNISKFELLGICHDDPTVTESQNLRYDACISLSKSDMKLLEQKGFDTKIIAGGKFAVLKGKKHSIECLDSWYGLFNWCKEEGYTFRNESSFEEYINLEESLHDLSQLISTIYIPIE